jgi:tungstate transport system substrate-binding protein
MPGFGSGPESDYDYLVEGVVVSTRRVPARLVVLALIITACAASVIGAAPQAGQQIPVLRLATTTSTADTGLLGALLPGFEKQCACRVDVIAVGTGQALALGRRGDVDVLLVHAPDQEAAFVAEGHAARRDDVMYNDFVIVGPAGDPAGVAKASTAKEAFRLVAAAKATFASRGDASGTHTKELAIWKSAGMTPGAAGTPDAAWYLSVGQGMGEALTFANERQAYALSDRATWLSMRARLPNLRVLFGGASVTENPDRDLRNQYGVIPIDPARHPGVNGALALRFADWLLSKPIQVRIAAFGREAAGQSLFYPDSDDYKSTGEIRVVAGSRSRTFTLDQLRTVTKVELADHEVVGVKKGPLGRYRWSGASLKDLLLTVDPSLASPSRSSSTIEVISSDGWTATMTWDELFGQVGRGEGLYRAKGCNECHGLRAEGTRPEGKRPAPRLLGESFPVAETTAMIRSGTGQHAGITAYTADRLSDADLAAVLGWLAKPARTGSADLFVVPTARQAVVLAYDRDGRPMTGREGVIQLVVGPDEFASRYSHWVAEVRVR